MSLPLPSDFTLPEAFEATYEVLEEIYIEGGEELYSRYITEKSPAFSVKSTLDLIFCVVESLYIRKELGPTSNFLECPEPVPCSIDTWARNAIHTYKKFRIPQVEELLPFQSDSKSIGRKSARSTRSAFGRRVKGKVVKGKEPQESIGEIPQSYPILQVKTTVTEEEEYLRVKKEAENKKKAEEDARVKALKAELEEKERKIKKEAGEMKHKQFTYDTSGNIIYINHLKYDQIPKIFTEVECKQIEGAKDSANPNQSRGKKKIEEANRIKTAPVREQEWIRNMTSVQPAIFDLIKLNPGVTLLDGPRVKHPLTAHSSQKYLTRKEYNQMSVPVKNQGISINYEKQLPKVNSYDSFKQTSGLSSRLGVLDEFPDYENAEEIIGEDLEIRDFHIPTRQNINQGKITVFGPGNQINEDNPFNKFNSEIMKNKAWGVNPGLVKPSILQNLPKKPNSKDLREIYGNIAKKPKDQPFITPKELWETQGAKMKKPRERPFLEKVDKKKPKLPVPPYGFTMINVLPDLDDFMKSNQPIAKSTNSEEIGKNSQKVFRIIK